MKCINNQIFKCFHISHLAGGNICALNAPYTIVICIWKCGVCLGFIGFHQPDLPYLMDYSEICEFRDGHFRTRECDRHFSLGRLNFGIFFFFCSHKCFSYIQDVGSIYFIVCELRILFIRSLLNRKRTSFLIRFVSEIIYKNLKPKYILYRDWMKFK